MTLSYLAWLSLLAIFVYLISQDANIIDYIYLWSERVRSWYMRATTWAKVHPKSPWMVLHIRKQSDKNAKILAKELGLDKNEDWHE